MTTKQRDTRRSGGHGAPRRRARGFPAALGLTAALALPVLTASCAQESDDGTGPAVDQHDHAGAQEPGAHKTSTHEAATRLPRAEAVHAAHLPEGSPLKAEQGAAHARCMGPMPPDPRDDQLPNEPTIIQVGRNQDVVVPQLVLDWMKEHEFEQAHDGWHLIRRWDQGCRRSNAPAEGCSAAQRLLNQGLWRAPIQQGAPGDGVAFLMAHRHMIEMLKQSFPKHAHLFSGFKKIPKTRGDAENPMPWKNISWTQNNLRGFDILENIERNVGMFANEDELGHFIQGSIRWTPERPSVVVSQPGSGLHGALHAQWSVAGSPAALINQAIDVRNHIFWKLHGWIDDIWERYRVAKGMKQSDADYQKLHYEQCMEMHELEPRNRKGVAPTTTPPPTRPTDESGMFARSIRPFLDTTCTGCHSAQGGAAAGLVLGGAGLSTAEVLEGIVGVISTNGEYKLVEPGKPDESWLYLKASGASERVTCSGGCDRQRMPPAGATLTSAQLATLRQWIQNGATAN